MATKIRIRRDTAANWTANNPILANAEPGFETDTKRRKIGDGSTAWNSLSYDDPTLEQTRAKDNKLFGDIDANGSQITNLSEPVDPQEAATKNYVDAKKQIFTDTSGVLTAGNYLDWVTPTGERYLFVILSNTLAGETPYTAPSKFTRIAPERGVLKKTKRVGVSGNTVRLNGILYHNGKVYSANSATNNITIFNAATFELLATIVFTGPGYFTYVQSIDEIWCSSNNSLIIRISPTTNASLGTFAPASVNMQQGVYYSASKVFIPNLTLNNRIDIINPSTFATDANITTQTGPRFPVYNTALDRIYVANNASNSVSIIDPSTNTNIANVAFAPAISPFDMSHISSLNRYLVTSSSNNKLITFTPGLSGITQNDVITLPDGYVTRKCVYVPEYDVVIITASSINTLWEIFVFDPQTNKIIYNWLINATGLAGGTPGPLGLTYNSDLKEVIAGAEQHGRLECFKV